MPRWLRALGQEPLVQFALIAGVLWLLVPPQTDAPGGSPVVRVARTQVAARASDPAQQAATVAALVDEELLLREADERGLSRRDPETRARLLQLTQQLLSAGVGEPDRAALEAWYAAHADALTRPTRITLEHLFFRAGPGDAQRAQAALDRVRAGAAPAGLGDPHAIGSAPSVRTLPQLRRFLDEALCNALERAPLGQWSGPWRAADGLHLARVTQRAAPAAPPLDEVLDAVRSGWLAEQRGARLEAWLAARRSGVSVELE